MTLVPPLAGFVSLEKLRNGRGDLGVAYAARSSSDGTRAEGRLERLQLSEGVEVCGQLLDVHTLGYLFRREPTNAGEKLREQ